MRITDITKDAVFKKVDLFEDYKSFIDQKKYATTFEARGVLHATALEEFCYYLFKDLVAPYALKKNVVLGRAQVFEDLQFTPSNFTNMLMRPNVSIKKKDQDFVIGTEVKASFFVVGSKITGALLVEGSKMTTTIVIPAVAIECKTYIDKTMLDGAAYAAERMKRGNPFCLYMIVAEYVKLIAEEKPQLTEVDEIYILRKQKVVDRAKRYGTGWVKQPIDKKLVWDLFNMVKSHLEKRWLAPRITLEKGKLIQA